MKLRIYQIDAFADQVFRGNPAAVVPLAVWLEDTHLQGIAAENNLSETAFFIPNGEKYYLRWFTPTQEVSLCGHATLAAAFVILTILEPAKTSVQFDTLSGELGVERNNDLLTLNFPSQPPLSCLAPQALLAGLQLPEGTKPQVLQTAANYYAVLAHESEILALQPDLELLAQLHPYGVVVTAPGDHSDFVCRYFAPSYGIPEDPVTGSIHCGLIPYWSERLGKTKLFARQVSQRGGELHCEWLDQRVAISGKAVKYLEGDIYV